MSSKRPDDLDYTVRVFAEDTNYPAGGNPWNGQPTKVEPPGAATTGFVPGTGAGAAYMNKLLNELFTQNQQVRTSLQETLDYTGQIPATSFRVVDAAAPYGGLNNRKDIAFDPLTKAWVMITSDDEIRFSLDGLNIFAGNEESPGGSVPNRIIINDAGEVLVVTTTQDVYWGTDFQTLGQYVAALPNAIDSGTSRAVFDESNLSWCAVGEATTTLRIASSTDGTTWTARTASANIATVSSQPELAADRDGNILLVALTAATTLRVSKSTDGGETWTDLTTITPAGNVQGPLSIFYDVDTDTWHLTATISGGGFRYWTSTNTGTSWSGGTAMPTDFQDIHLVAMGSLLVVGSRTQVQQLGYSTDGGATWYATGVQGAGQLRVGNGRLVLIGDNYTMVSSAGVGHGVQIG